MTDNQLAKLAKQRGGSSLTVNVPKARKPSKYRNVPTLWDGVRYSSKAEAEYAMRLDEQLRNNEIRGWTRQTTFYLGCPDAVYRTDFVVFEWNGAVTAVDVKGKRTSKFARDVKLWRRYGPCLLCIVTGGKVVETVQGRTPTFKDREAV